MVKAEFDVSDILSGGDQVLFQMANISTHIHPLRIQMIYGSQIYEASSDREETGYFWFPPEDQRKDPARGLVFSCQVSVPRAIWPARGGPPLVLGIRASACVEFVHRSEGNRVVREARATEVKTYTVYAS